MPATRTPQVLPLVLEPDPRLHQVCLPTEIHKVFELAEDMLTTMYANKGCGLAAPQVGHLVRLLVMDCSPTRDKPQWFVNPVLLTQEFEEDHEEGCLSFPGETRKVKRATRVTFLADNHTNKVCTANGLWAVCLLHELDHLNGITFDSRGSLLPTPPA